MNVPWHARIGEFARKYPFITTAIILVILTLAGVAIFVPGGWFWSLVILGAVVVIVVFAGVIAELEGM